MNAGKNVLKQCIIAIFIIFLIAFIPTSVYAKDKEKNPKKIDATEVFYGQQVEFAKNINKTTLKEFYKNKGVQFEVQPKTLGQIESFWVSNISNSTRYLINAELKKIGTYSYLYVQTGLDSIQYPPISDTVLNTLVTEFDTNIYNTIRNNFGTEYNIDGDPKITIVIHPIVGGAAGYFFPGDEYPSYYYPYSNQREMFYVDYNLVANYVDYAKSTLAHEFQHMIHWNADPIEETWVNEGMSQLAEIIAGYGPDEYSISSFLLNNSNIPLTDHYMLDAPSYGKDLLFMYYLYEKYGGSQTLKSIVATPQTSVEGIQQSLSSRGYAASVQKIYRDWIIANFIDDSTVGSQYGYNGLDIRAILAQNGYSIQDIYTHNYPNTTPYTATGQYLYDWQHDYNFFTPINVIQEINFNGQTTLAGAMNLQIIKSADDSFSPGTNKVETLALNGAFDYYSILADLGTQYKAAVVIPSVSSNQSVNFYLGQYDLTVRQPVNYSTIISDTIPTIMEIGKSYSVSLTVYNNGSAVWTAGENYRLGAVGNSDPFATARQYLATGESIGPGQAKTFNFTMKAPNTPGQYITDWRMLKEGVAWFGTTLTKTVTVINPNNATIVSNTIPTAMEVGKNYAVSITVRNDGTSIWTAGENYRLGAVDNSDPFAAARQYLVPGDSIEPGQSKTFTFTVTAPGTAGQYTTDWRMLREGVVWFGTTLTKNVTVSQPFSNATIISDTIPTNMGAGISYSVSITVRNDGTTTWTAADNYRLGAVGNSDPFTAARQYLTPGESIEPGQSKTFTFTMTAPGTAGQYTTDWRMLREGVAWFGTTLTKNVTVSQPTNNAAIISDTIPTSMVAGQSYNISITVRNDGTSVWTAADNYRLGAVGNSDPFAPARQFLASGESIGPGQSKTFTFTMTAPSTPGQYTTDWRMLKEYVAWFGTTLIKTISVSQPSNNATIISHNIPSSMVAGQSYNVSITVRNDGTSVWTAGENYRLGAVGNSDPFASGRQLLAPGESIGPGQSKTFNFIMTAPSASGQYTTDWRMLKEYVAWFGSTLTVNVNVS